MLPFLANRNPPPGHPLLDELLGQALIHSRVAARGTWTVTARGWVLHSRIQRIGEEAVGLRDARLLGAVVDAARMDSDGALALTLESAGAPARQLTTTAPWDLHGPRGAHLQADEKGELNSAPPGAPRYATPERLAEHEGSRPSGLEQRLLLRARGGWLHPGHVVEALAGAGALDDEEFERRGPVLLARMLARGELRAGFVVDGRFSPWSLSLTEVVEHIGTTWTALGGRAPGADMIAWFELTGTGRDRVGPSSSQVMPPGMSGYDSPGVVGGFR